MEDTFIYWHPDAIISSKSKLKYVIMPTKNTPEKVNKLFIRNKYIPFKFWTGKPFTFALLTACPAIQVHVNFHLRRKMFHSKIWIFIFNFKKEKKIASNIGWPARCEKRREEKIIRFQEENRLNLKFMKIYIFFGTIYWFD